MDVRKMKNFVQFQCCMLLLLLTILPELSVGSLFGLPDLNIPVAICKVVGLIGAGLALKYLYESEQQQGKQFSMPLLISACVGMVLVLLPMFPKVPSWLEWIAIVALVVALFLSKSSLDIKWANASVGGAYLVLLAVLLHVYNGVNDILMVDIAALIGLVLYLVGLARLKSALDPIGLQGISKLKIAIIIGMVAVVLGWIPLLGWILGGIPAIIAFIFEFLGYGCLKSSSTIGVQGREGAGKLRISMIIVLIGVVLGWIPGIGDTLQGFVSLVVLFLVYQGWTKIVCGLSIPQEMIEEKIEE